jgi:hypothetical protein
VQGKISRYTPQTGTFIRTRQTVENKKSRQKALKSRPFDGGCVQNKNANVDTLRIKISVLICAVTKALIQFYFSSVRVFKF